MRRLVFIHCAVLTAALALMAISLGCDKVSGVYIGAKFSAVNNTDVAVHVYLNSVFEFSLEAGANNGVKGLDAGKYTAEARRQSDGTVVNQEDIYLSEGERFMWDIELRPVPPASLVGSPPSDARVKK